MPEGTMIQIFMNAGRHNDTNFYKLLGVLHDQQLQIHSNEHHSCLNIGNSLRNLAELITELLPLPQKSAVKCYHTKYQMDSLLFFFHTELCVIAWGISK